MNLYKKFIPKKTRFALLKALKFIPDKQMIKFQYWMKLKRNLDLDNPQRYTEKIQWYKLYYRNSDMPICVDKYRVREYIKRKGMEDHLVHLYAAYDKPEDIDLASLPDKFILKTTNGSGTNIICKDKSKLGQEEVVSKVEGFLKQSSASAGREWPYAHVTPKIIVEQLLEDSDSVDGAVSDYKFLCFNGKPEYIVLDVDRFTNHKRNIYDTGWHDLHVASDCPCAEGEYAPPENLDEMIQVAEKLCADFPAVRVDLYSVGGRTYFGELTFFPWSGYVQYIPDAFDFEMGEKFILPEKSGGGYNYVVFLLLGISCSISRKVVAA